MVPLGLNGPNVTTKKWTAQTSSLYIILERSMWLFTDRRKGNSYFIEVSTMDPRDSSAGKVLAAKSDDPQNTHGKRGERALWSKNTHTRTFKKYNTNQE